ncbi:hypothetical protein AMTRI_Chr07g81430 [Amborella trichopoda]
MEHQFVMNFKTLKVIQSKLPNSGIFFLYLNNPSRRNALTPQFFKEFPKALSLLYQKPICETHHTSL